MSFKGSVVTPGGYEDIKLDTTPNNTHFELPPLTPTSEQRAINNASSSFSFSNQEGMHDGNGNSQTLVTTT